MTWFRVAVAAVILAVTLAITAAVIDFNDWVQRCETIAGVVEERYEYTYWQTSYTYNANGTIATVIMLPQDVYSYHCWVNGEEIEVPDE